MKKISACKIVNLAAFVCGVAFLAGCGDDESFSPMAKNRGYDYAVTSPSGLSEYPCNEMREGRDAVVGRDKDMYTCIFDRTDSVYLWAGKNDTLTAKGKEFERKSSSSSRNSSSSRYSSSSYSSSSLRSSSSERPYSSGPVVYDTTDYPKISKEDFFNPDIDYGEMVDPRDGKVYRTVEVDGKVWMAENLNYYDATNSLLKRYSYCYNDDEDNCDLMGRLYERAAAMNDERCFFGEDCGLGDGPIQGICPDGWHIPSKSEVEELNDYIGKLNASDARSAVGWGSPTASIPQGSDSYGLSFIGAGNFSEGKFRYRGEYTHAWAYYASSYQYYLLIQGEANALLLWEFDRYEMNISVRCVKGAGSTQGSFSGSSSSSQTLGRYPTMEIPFTLESRDDLLNPDVDYGTLTDDRDGKVYRTVKVGNSEWMAENLNFAGGDDYPLLKNRSVCFNDDEANCDLLGRLYAREAALNTSDCSLGHYCEIGDTLVRGVCPKGWHIPSESEAEDFVYYFNENVLGKMSAKGWMSGIDGESNSLGFSMPGSGCLNLYSKEEGFDSAGETGYVWIYTQTSSLRYLIFNPGATQTESLLIHTGYTYDLFASVRCVKD